MTFYHYKRLFETLWLPRDVTLTIDYYSNRHYELTARKTLGDGQIIRHATSLNPGQWKGPKDALNAVAMLLQFLIDEEFMLKNGDRKFEWLYHLEQE